MSETINTRGHSDGWGKPVHSLIKGTGSSGKFKSEVDPLSVKRSKNIDPVATHIKEVNHIDPVTIESLRVSSVKGMEPIRVKEVNVTNIPTLNHTVRQMPAMDMSVRRVPPMSVGIHQHFEVPSEYHVRASVLGFEVGRLTLKGKSWIIPHQTNKPERHIEQNRSYPVEAVVGNPSIPVHCRTVSEHAIPSHRCAPTGHRHHPPVPKYGIAETSRHPMHVTNHSSMNTGTVNPGGMNV